MLTCGVVLKGLDLGLGPKIEYQLRLTAHNSVPPVTLKILHRGYFVENKCWRISVRLVPWRMIISEKGLKTYSTFTTYSAFRSDEFREYQP